MIRQPASSSLGAIFVLLTVMAFNVNLIGPILGELQAEFDVSLPVLGLLLSMQAVARAVAIVPAGFLADRLPPHTPLTAGTLCTAVGCAISALALDYRVLLAGVLVTGLGTALVYTTGLAHTVRSSEGSDRSHTAGRILAAVQMGALLAPMLSGVAASTFGWRAAFALGALVGGIAALLPLLFVRAPQPAPESGTAPIPRLARLGMSPSLLPVVGFSVLMLGAGTFAIKQVLLPLYGSVGLDFDPARVGLVLTLANALRTLVTYKTGPVMDRLGHRRALIATGGLSVAAALLLVFPAGLAWYILVAVLFAPSGLVTPLPAVLIAERMPRTTVGRSIGIMHLSVDLAALAVAPLITLLLDVQGFGVVGIAVAASFVVSTLIGLTLVRSRPVQPEPEPLSPPVGTPGP